MDRGEGDAWEGAGREVRGRGMVKACEREKKITLATIGRKVRPD
jgi:hypothetical protein